MFTTVTTRWTCPWARRRRPTAHAGRSSSARHDRVDGRTDEWADVALVPLGPSGTDEGDCQAGQRVDRHGGAVVVQGQALAGQQPAQSAFDHPTVPSQGLTGSRPMRAIRAESPAAAQTATDSRVVALVPVQFRCTSGAVQAAGAADDGRVRRPCKWPVGRCGSRGARVTTTVARSGVASERRAPGRRGDRCGRCRVPGVAGRCGRVWPVRGVPPISPR